MPRYILDMECNRLVNPDKIHCIVVKDVETEDVKVFRKPQETGEFQEFLGKYGMGNLSFCGHNSIGFDFPILDRLLALGLIGDRGYPRLGDTLVVSRLVNFNRPGGHGLESYGEEFGVKKPPITDWSVYSEEIVSRCVEDVEINFLLYKKLEKYFLSERWQSALETEHYLQWVCNDLHENGFNFDLASSLELLARIQADVAGLDNELQTAFPPKAAPIREVTPRVTKHGTLNRNDFRWAGDDLSDFNGGPFTLIEFRPFNPASSPQRIERLNEAGWKPTEKTDGHKDAEKRLRELTRNRRHPGKFNPSAGGVGSGASPRSDEIADLERRIDRYRVYGWKCSEENLATLPEDAPEAAKSLARRLILGNRVSTLESWISLYNPETKAIHGKFHGIGAWTHRMAHSDPNMGNVPKFNADDPETTPYSDEMRALWVAGEDEYLIGVDADSIQMRIFAHYAEDPELIQALVAGRKEDGTDPHSVNKRALGAPCKSRDDAKTYYYAWVLGVGKAKGADILKCSYEESTEAAENFLKKYPGLKYIKQKVIPEDAARGYFQGLDGRFVKIYGDTEDDRKHFAFAGYLQNGEKVVMSRALQIWYPRLSREFGERFKIRNFVHDEYQFTLHSDFGAAEFAAKLVAGSIRQVGEDLGIRCPMAGSILGSNKRLAIGKNWLQTH